jgi:hypothetical protein
MTDEAEGLGEIVEDSTICTASSFYRQKARGGPGCQDQRTSMLQDREAGKPLEV